MIVRLREKLTGKILFFAGYDPSQPCAVNWSSDATNIVVVQENTIEKLLKYLYLNIDTSKYAIEIRHRRK